MHHWHIYGGLVLIAFCGIVRSKSPCKDVLKAANHYSTENEESCKARVQHNDIKEKINAACLSTSADEAAKKQWQDFKKEYAKSYDDDVAEFLHCISFQDNLRRIELHNAKHKAGQSNYHLKVTEFADMSDEEFRIIYLGPGGEAGTKPSDASKYPKFNDNPPDALDYREKGWVTTPAGNQRSCGACWAFASVAAVEGQYFRKTKQLKKLSEQEVVDCTYSKHNGCMGGFQGHAFDFMKKNGIALLKDYPFVAKRGPCKQADVTAVTHVSQHHMLPLDDEELMKKAVATVGPIVIAFYELPQIRLYGGGVFDYSRGCDVPTKVNHVVLVVGYGTTDKGQKYWILKNSVGPKWGENGFFKVPRGIKYCTVGHEVSVVEI